jgi:hypothetical protein
MKVLTTLVFAAGAAFCAQAPVDAPAAKAKTEFPQGVPKGASVNADGTWSYTDNQGKSWTYSNTPFGVSKKAAVVSEQGVPTGIPKGAVKNADGTYSFSDKTGKHWTYTSTMFGFVKRAALPPGEVAHREPGASQTSEVTVIDKGDSVRFEQMGLMGKTGYEKKKTDLTPEERRLYDAKKSKPE